MEIDLLTNPPTCGSNDTGSLHSAYPLVLSTPEVGGGFFHMTTSGWIKLHRKIIQHWIWDNSDYLKAWICILIDVNHEGKKVLIERELIECNRGQSLNSLPTWTKKFGRRWTISKTRTFLNLLKNDSMIVSEGLRKTTRLTVCNYDIYQDVQQTDSRLIADKSHPDNILTTSNKNRKNVKNDKKDIISDFKKSLSVKFIKIHTDFYKLQTDELYSFQAGRDGKAIKSMIDYVYNAIKAKDKEPTEELMLDYWQKIFDNYNKWNDFNKGQIKVTQILSQLPNIIQDIKNYGKPKVEPPKVAGFTQPTN